MTVPDDAGDERGGGLSFELVAMNIGFVVLVCSIVWGVLSRYVTESPATWVEEVSSIAFTWVVPLLLIANVPARTLRYGLNGLDLAGMAGATAILLVLSTAVFRAGLRRYGSASS